MRGGPGQGAAEGPARGAVVPGSGATSPSAIVDALPHRVLPAMTASRPVQRDRMACLPARSPGWTGARPSATAMPTPWSPRIGCRRRASPPSYEHDRRCVVPQCRCPRCVGAARFVDVDRGAADTDRCCHGRSGSTPVDKFVQPTVMPSPPASVMRLPSMSIVVGAKIPMARSKVPLMMLSRTIGVHPRGRRGRCAGRRAARCPR